MTVSYSNIEIHEYLIQRVKDASIELGCPVEQVEDTIQVSAHGHTIAQHSRFNATWIIDSGREGRGLSRNITIFGGVHGDEPAGVFAVENLLLGFIRGEIALPVGQVTVCVVNERGVYSCHRHGNSTEDDMNRLFSDSLVSRDPYVARRMTEVKSIVREASALLDLHTTTASSPRFALTEPVHTPLASQLQVPFVLELASRDHVDFLANTSCFFAARNKVPALIVECGQHQQRTSCDNAFDTARAFLQACCGEKVDAKPLMKPTRLLRVAFIHEKKMSDLIPQDSIEFKYSREFDNFELLPAGTLIATERALCPPFQQEISYRTTEDSYICLPSKYEKQKKDDYIFMLATVVNCFTASTKEEASTASPFASLRGGSRI